MQKTMMRKGIAVFAVVCILFMVMTVTAFAQVTQKDTEGMDPEITLEAPQNVKAVSDAVNTITLTWDQVSGAQGYLIYRTDLSDPIDVPGGDTLKYTDTSAIAGRYFYTVVAYGEDGEEAIESADSEPVSAASKIAAPTLKSAAAVSYNSIKLEWSKVQGADGYYVYAGNQKITCAASASSYTYKSAIPTQWVSFQVQAFYNDGSNTVISESSSTKKARTVLTAPVMKSAAATSSKTLKFSWSKVAGATGYEMFINGKSIGTTTGTSFSYYSGKKGVTLSWGKTYRVTVRAYRTVNGKKYYSDRSNKAKSAVMRPAAVTMSSAKGTAYNAVTIKWKTVTGASGYYIYRSTDGGKAKKIATVKGAKVSSYIDKKVSLGKKYKYSVRAYWQSGSKTQTGAVGTAKTATAKLATPKLSTPKTGKTSITVKWKKVAGAQGYYVYRKTGKASYKKIATVKSGSKTSYTDKNVKMNTTYVYTVKAYRKSGSTYKSDWNEKGKSVTLKIKSREKVVTDKSSVLYGKTIRLYYYPDGEQMQDVTSVIGKQDSYQIYVNRTRNQVTIYAKDGKVYIPVKAFICSVGRSETATPLGTYTTKYQYRWQEMMGPSWGQWVTRITWDGILFHSVFYNSPYNNNSLSVTQYNNLGKAASHGCIRLTAGDAKWIYDNCKVGTKVVIYVKNGYEPLKKPTAYKLPSWHTWDPTDPNMKSKCKKHGCHQ